MDNFMNEFIAVVDGTKLLLLVALIVGNFIAGLAASIYTKEFRLKKIADFMVSRVLPYILGYFTVGVIAVIEPSWAMSVGIIWGIILAALIGHILSNLKDMGINLPDSLAGPPPEW